MLFLRMEVILDTNFIIACVMKKIDFLEQLGNEGFTPVVPKEVIEEMKDLKKESRTSQEERVAIDVAFKLFEQGKVKKTKLSKIKVDEGLIEKGKQGIHIATLDNGIKRQVPNKIIIQGATKQLMVERS